MSLFLYLYFYINLLIKNNLKQNIENNFKLCYNNYNISKMLNY